MNIIIENNSILQKAIDLAKNQNGLEIVALIMENERINTREITVDKCSWKWTFGVVRLLLMGDSVTHQRFGFAESIQDHRINEEIKEKYRRKHNLYNIQK